jgi:Glycosyltransferase like family
VFNDPEVRRRCLDRSLEDHRDEANVEYLPVDNVDGSFASAGAALNHGASLASRDYLVFVHQDVYLHSLRALEEAAGLLADDERIGLVGASGITSTGDLAGRIRDRVVLTGEPARRPTDVDSLDEVLFVVPRRLIEREPLAELPELAWHAYAVEYGVRARALGLRVCAVDIPLTHNSLTVNLAKLNAAYASVAARYPEALPVRATCGTITARSEARPRRRFLASYRWRYRWLRESLAVHAARRAAGGGSCVLGDIRQDVDEVMDTDADSPLLVMNLDPECGFADERPGPLDLTRRGRSIMLTSGGMGELADTVGAWSPGASLLLTNLRLADLKLLAAELPRASRLLGFRREIGYWMLIGAAATAVPRQWRLPNARPLGMPALAP